MWRIFQSATLVAAVFFSACSVPTDVLDNQQCPCIEGWTCDLSGVCVEPPALPMAPPNVPTDCWRDLVAACDWTPETFEFTPDNSPIAALRIDHDPVFSPDGCLLYFTENGQQQVARRRSATSSFEAAELVQVPSIGVVSSNASITPDGLQLYFARRQSGQASIWRAVRDQRDEAWRDPSPVPGLNVLDESNWDGILAPHGLRFYWAPTGVSQDIWVAERASLDAPFTNGRPLEGLASALPESEPAVTADGRVIVLTAGDPARLVFARRNDWRDPFESSQPVPGDMVEDVRARESTISPDGCEILVNLDGVMTRLVHRGQ